MNLAPYSLKALQQGAAVDERLRRRYIVAIFVLAFVIRIAYAIVAPPFQAPDEFQHFSYVKYVHDAGRLPVQHSPATDPAELEFHQPPLYYFLAAPLIPTTKLIQARPLLILRLFNVLLAMMTIAVTYYFTAHVLKWSPFSVALACGVFALLPTYSYTSATVRNGTLATLFASLGLCLSAKTLLDEKPKCDSRWVWVGAVVGLALLSKLTAIGVVFATALTVVGTSPNWQALIRRSAWFTFGVASTAGWWFVRNLMIYGRPFAIVEDGYEFLRSPMSWAHEKQSAITIFKTFWAVFGRVNEHYFTDIYRFCWWFAGLAALGIVGRYLLHGGELPDIPKKLTAFFAMAIGASIVATMYYAHNYNSDQGRYLFPVLIPITTFVTVGLNSLVHPRYRRLVVGMVLVAFASINAIVLARLAAVYWQIG